ncbi:MAG: diadenylate cyclase CdaA [Phycisphaerales bacterium]|nr:MAG: diadenylate cyclase CdaA [Phycisphaerales bacterium]
MIRSLEQIIRSYELYEVIIEMAVIWLCVYLIVRFLRGTRGAGVVKGVAVLLVLLTLLIRVLGQGTDTFGRLNFIYERFLGLLAILLIVVFQPELRQAMIRLGYTRLLRGSRRELDDVVRAVSEAVRALSRNRFGALIALERGVQLGGLVEGGEAVDARLSARLLESIFWPSNPLHDLGVVVRGNRIIAASVLFPLAEEGYLPHRYGSRHRAAVGLTLDSDCVVVVVSEETGAVSIAEHGRLEADIPLGQLPAALATCLRTSSPEQDAGSGGSEESSSDDVQAA